MHSDNKFSSKGKIGWYRRINEMFTKLLTPGSGDAFLFKFGLKAGYF